MFTFILHNHNTVQSRHTPIKFCIMYIILIIINPHGLIYISLQFFGCIYHKNNCNSFSHLSNRKYNYLTISKLIKIKTWLFTCRLLWSVDLFELLLQWSVNSSIRRDIKNYFEIFFFILINLFWVLVFLYNHFITMHLCFYHY